MDEHKFTRLANFWSELGPRSALDGRVFFWSWGFWDSRPDLMILTWKNGVSMFCMSTFGHLSKEPASGSAINGPGTLLGLFLPDS